MRQKGTLREVGGSLKSKFVATATLMTTLQRTRTWRQESRGEYKATYQCAKTAPTMGCQWRIRGVRRTRYR